MVRVTTLFDSLEAVTTFQGRLTLTAVVLAVTVAVAWLVVPYAVRQFELFLDERLLSGQTGEVLRRIEEELPFRTSARYLVVAYQWLVYFTGLLALLALWGQGDLLADLATDSWDLLAEYRVVILPILLRLPVTIFLLLAAYVAVGLLEEFVDEVSERSDRIDEHQTEVIFRSLQFMLLIAVGLMVLGYWGVDLGGLLIGAGFLGIVLGMAAQKTLGAALAGFVLMFSKPFEVGDWIEVDDYEGIVTDITIVNTRVENFDGEYVVVPNDVVGNSTVINRTKKGRLRVRLSVGVDYSVDPERAEEIAMDAIKGLDEIMSVPRPQVIPTGFGDSAINLELRFWIDNPSARRRWRAKAAVVRAVYDAYEKEGIKIPFPQRELSGRAETGGFQMARQGVADDGKERDRAPAEPAPEPDEGDGTGSAPAEPPRD